MKRIYIAFIALFVVIILFLGALFIVPGLVPTDTYRDKMETELSQTLGRDVKINGDIKISTFPVVKIQTGSVSLANPEGFSDNNFADVEAMSAKVKLWPLFSKQVEISGVTFESPSIRLEKRADGAMNWTLGSPDEVEEETNETGPYKRDGRFTEYDPALTLLQISNGKFIYLDADSGREIKAEAINLDLRAPSLKKPVNIKGDLIIDGVATSLNGSLKSPFDFMSGLATTFEANIKTTEGEIETSGTFDQSEDIAFTANFNADINAPLAIAKRLPLPETVKIPELSSVKANGNVSYGPNLTRFPKIEFSTEGPGLFVSYNGTLDATDGVTADGDFEARLADMSVIEPYLKKPIDGLDLVKTVDVKGTLNWDGTRLSLPALNGAVDGTQLSASFNGSANYEDTLALSGDFEARADDVAVIKPYLKTPIDALNALKTVDAKGTMDWNGTRLNLSALNGSVVGPQMNATYNGSGSFDKTLSLYGAFTGDTPNLDSFLKEAGITQADAVAIKRISTSGNIQLTNTSQVKLSDFSAKASEGFVNGQYNGDIGFDKKLSLNGQMSGDIPDLGALNAAIPREIPYADVAKRISLSSRIDSKGTGFALSDLTAALDDGLLTGDFSGQLTTGNESTISGTLNVAAASLRAIARSQNVDLPASTDAGSIFERLQISGQVSGTPDRISFSNGTLGFDALSGSGNFVMETRRAKPRLTGNLSLGELDVRPYMAAWSEQKPTGQILPWATTSIDLSPLNAVDAQIDLSTSAIIMDRIQLGQTDTNVKIQNGTLTTDIRKAQLYNGQVDGSFAIGSSSGLPTISMRTNVKSVDTMSFLMATGGFDKVTGTNDLTMSINGSGNSQDAIMKSLSGSGTFNVVNGQILGLDVEGLISGADQAFVSKQLPSSLVGIGGSTNFDDLDGSFSVTKGRATINQFKVRSRTLYMDAEGAVDVGEQNIDFRIRPALSEGSDIAQFGIPIRFSGKFGQAKPGLDSNFVSQIVEAKARQAARNAITDRVGGPVGDILGGFLGGESTTDSSQSSSTTNSSSPLSGLGLPIPGLEPRQPAPTTPAPTQQEAPPPPEEQIEEKLEDALKGLFGKKKK